MTKNETGTWGLGRGTWDSGKWGRGTRECRDAGTWGLGDEGRVMHGDSRTWEVGTWGCDKQTSPDFCAEFVKYIFGSPVRWLIGTKLFHRVKTSQKNSTNHRTLAAEWLLAWLLRLFKAGILRSVPNASPLPTFSDSQ